MEATFGMLYVTTVEYLCQWLLSMGSSIFLLNHKLHILGQEHGSQIVYTMCYYSRIYKSCISIVELWLVNLIIHVRGTFGLNEPLELIYIGCAF